VNTYYRKERNVRSVTSENWCYYHLFIASWH